MFKTASEIEVGMVIQVKYDKDLIEVDEVWENQGPGLGVMIKGFYISSDKRWEQRFVSPDTETVMVVGDRQ